LTQEGRLTDPPIAISALRPAYRTAGKAQASAPELTGNSGQEVRSWRQHFARAGIAAIAPIEPSRD
jgi:hypothetical protein